MKKGDVISLFNVKTGKNNVGEVKTVFKNSFNFVTNTGRTHKAYAYYSKKGFYKVNDSMYDVVIADADNYQEKADHYKKVAKEYIRKEIENDLKLALALQKADESNYNIVANDLEEIKQRMERRRKEIHRLESVLGVKENK